MRSPSNDKVTAEQISRFVWIAEKYRDIYGEMPADLARKWIRENPRKNKKGIIVRFINNHTGEICAQGTISECADLLGWSAATAYATICNVREGLNKKWTIEVVNPDV